MRRRRRRYPPKGFQRPGVVDLRSAVSQDIEVSIIRLNLEEVVLRSIPLIDYLLHMEDLRAKHKPDWSFIRFATGVAFHLDLHLLPVCIAGLVQISRPTDASARA